MLFRKQGGSLADSCICTIQDSSHTGVCSLRYSRRTHLYLEQYAWNNSPQIKTQSITE